MIYARKQTDKNLQEYDRQVVSMTVYICQAYHRPVSCFPSYTDANYIDRLLSDKVLTITWLAHALT